jgi:vanillate O-demethylase monooxygenase subunit
VLNAITPIDAHSSWYYYAFCRNFGLESAQATAELVEGLRLVLQEDADALRLQEIGLQSRPPGEDDVLIGQDAGLAKARRIHARLLAEEAANVVPA